MKDTLLGEGSRSEELAAQDELGGRSWLVRTVRGNEPFKLTVSALRTLLTTAAERDCAAMIA